VSYGKHHFSLKGAAAEKVVHDLAAESFFTDWCYPNPQLADGKELCDLLVVFDHVAIIIQVKNLKLNEGGRYNRKEVDKNIRQLSGALRRLINDRRPITLANPRRGVETLAPSAIEETYLLSVLAGEGEDCFPAMEAVKDKSAHVFTGEFLEIVLSELDTISDFVGYLRAKEALLQNLPQLLILGGEEELLAIYLLNNRTFGELTKAMMAVVDEGSWAMLQQRPDYIAKKREDEVSYGWDNLIDHAHEGGSPEYELLAREMARPNRFERRCLAKAFLDAHVMAHRDLEHDLLRRVVSSDHRTYCFLFMEDLEPRNRRRGQLEALCYVARGKFAQNPVVIGIATEKRIRPMCAYDFCMLDLPDWTDEDAKRVEEIRLTTGVLTNTTTREAHEDEYPDVGEQLNEEELALFDLLTKPQIELSAAEREESSEKRK
jgi:hypothetical protein